MLLPLFKLGALAIKTLSKPIAIRLKIEAGKHPRFRKSIITLAQANHRITTQLQRRIYSHATDVFIRPLNEEKAVQEAADLIGELFVFSVEAVRICFQAFEIVMESAPHSPPNCKIAGYTCENMIGRVGGGVIIFEWQRSSRSEHKKEEKLREEKEALRQRDEQLSEEIELLKSQVEELGRLAHNQGLFGVLNLRHNHAEQTKPVPSK